MTQPPLLDSPERSKSSPDEEMRRDPTRDQFLRLCQSLPLAVFETEANDRCLYANPRWSEITGQIGEQIDGHGWRDAIHDSDREWVLEEVDLARGQERMFDADFRVQRPDGSIRWVHGRSLPLHQPDGTHDGFIHVVYDVTDRKCIEEQLRCSLKELKEEGELHRKKLRQGVAQLSDLLEEASAISAEATSDPDGVRKSNEASRVALDELRVLLAEEVVDHSLDDFLL